MSWSAKFIVHGVSDPPAPLEVWAVATRDQITSDGDDTSLKSIELVFHVDSETTHLAPGSIVTVSGDC